LAETRCIEVRTCSHCFGGKAISITQTECVFVALGIQHAVRMRHIVIVACPALQYFLHFFINGTISEKKKVPEHKIYALIFLYKFV
jgi:hypothetical protein